MSNFSFNEESINSASRSNNKTKGGLIGLVIKLGLAKNETGAKRALSIFVVIGLIITIYLAKDLVNPTPIPDLPPLTSSN